MEPCFREDLTECLRRRQTVRARRFHRVHRRRRRHNFCLHRHHQLKDHRHQSLVHSIQYIGKHARRLRPQLLEVRASRRRHHLLQKARASRCFQIFAGCVISRTTPHRAAVTVSARKLEIVVRTMPWSACRSTVEEILDLKYLNRPLLFILVFDAQTPLRSLTDGAMT